jgi:hypothetical protein
MMLDDYALDVATANLIRESGVAMTWDDAKRLATAAIGQYLESAGAGHRSLPVGGFPRPDFTTRCAICGVMHAPACGTGM